jgi:signal transduction histidine kinase
VALEMSPDGAGKESIRDDVAEMDAMIGEILEAARLDSPHGKLIREETDLGALTAEAARGFTGRRPGLKVLDAKGHASLVARVDRKRARKVLANVIDNALKYSAASEREVEVSFAPFEDVVGISVRDYGLGIPDDVKERLFEPFYRADPSRSRDTGGYGLGLSLCKRIMEAHEGRIEITGPPGGGTEVTVFFPRR